MVNLSTIYGVSIVLGSLAAVGSAIAGTKVYPIQTGGDPLAGPALLGATLTGAFAAAKKAIEPKPEPLATETVKEEAPDNKKNLEFEKINCNNTDYGKVCLYKPDSDEHDKVVYNESLPTEYFKEQDTFYKNLSDEDKNILKSYTLYGDRVLNAVLRKNYNTADLLAYVQLMQEKYGDKVVKDLFGVEFKEINNENVVDLSNTYLNKFMNVFNKAPTVKKEFTVFRGTKEPTPQFGGLLSTTYNALGYQLNLFSGPSCCVYELKLKEGVKALWMAPISEFNTEHEIIVSPNVSVTIARETTKEVWELDETIKKTTKTVYECDVAPSSEGNTSLEAST
jgi:hypothetical protein